MSEQGFISDTIKKNKNLLLLFNMKLVIWKSPAVNFSKWVNSIFRFALEANILLLCVWQICHHFQSVISNVSCPHSIFAKLQQDSWWTVCGVTLCLAEINNQINICHLEFLLNAIPLVLVFETQISLRTNKSGAIAFPLAYETTMQLKCLDLEGKKGSDRLGIYVWCNRIIRPVTQHWPALERTELRPALTCSLHHGRGRDTQVADALVSSHQGQKMKDQHGGEYLRLDGRLHIAVGV